jgi:hypothetical protein
VAQRFTAAITNLFSAAALAAEVMVRRWEHFFRNPLGSVSSELKSLNLEFNP